MSTCSRITVYDEGALIGKAKSLDFVGSGVTATYSGNQATISILGGGGMSTAVADATYARIDSTNQPFLSSGNDALDTLLRRAYDSTEVLSIDWQDRSLLDEAGASVLSWDDGQLYDDTSSQSSINWFARLLNDDTGAQSLDFGDRLAIDVGGQTSLDWGVRKAYEVSGGVTIDWENTQLIKNTIVVFDWSSGIFKDFLDTTSLDVYSRYMVDSAGNSKFDWENFAFPTLTTNGLLKVSGGTGNIGVTPNVGIINVTANVTSGYILTGEVLRFRAPFDFQASEWFVSSIDTGSVELDVWRNASAWPTTAADSICNTAYPTLVTTDHNSGSATTWDQIDKDDYIVVVVNSTSTLLDFNLQVLGDKV